jgi:hypothetical protein
MAPTSNTTLQKEKKWLVQSKEKNISVSRIRTATIEIARPLKLPLGQRDVLVRRIANHTESKNKCSVRNNYEN